MKSHFLKVLKKNIAYIVLSIILLILIYIAYIYYSKYFYLFKDLRKIKSYILSYKEYSIVAFLIMQIIQVVAFFIPGEVIQVAGGYIYGTFFGGLISAVGITLGSMIVYYISNIFGKPLISKIIPHDKIHFFHKLLNHGDINHIVFLLYLIPGIPKDVLAYICGISDVTPKNFFIYSTLGRLPGIFISAYFGAHFNKGNRLRLIIIAIFMIILFLLGVFKGEKIVKKVVKKH